MEEAVRVERSVSVKEGVGMEGDNGGGVEGEWEIREERESGR